jgi:hypothetical protein
MVGHKENCIANFRLKAEQPLNPTSSQSNKSEQKTKETAKEPQLTIEQNMASSSSSSSSGSVKDSKVIFFEKLFFKNFSFFLVFYYRQSTRILLRLLNNSSTIDKIDVLEIGVP